MNTDLVTPDMILRAINEGQDDLALKMLNDNPNLITPKSASPWLLDSVNNNCVQCIKCLIAHVADQKILGQALNEALAQQNIGSIHALAPFINQEAPYLARHIHGAQTPAAVQALLPHIKDKKQLNGILVGEMEAKRFAIMTVILNNMDGCLTTVPMIWALRSNIPQAMEILYPFYSFNQHQDILASAQKIPSVHYSSLDTLHLLERKVLAEALDVSKVASPVARVKKM